MFKKIFIPFIIGIGLIVIAFLFHYARPNQEINQPSAVYIRASGKCASCHSHETSAIIHQFSMSEHAKNNVTCFDCHRAQNNQEKLEHKGFIISKELTAMNCSQCHPTEYSQFLRSRHGAPSWAAVTGHESFTDEQISYAEKYHPGSVIRAPNKLAIAEGSGVLEKGCMACHSIGKPNIDGSIGSCTECHARHSTSIQLARQPETCGQCHMGPDHSQLEIYNESKHGVLYSFQKSQFNINVDSKELSAQDMSAPTCATCHMSGLEGMNVTHDVTERLSWWLFAPISSKRPNYNLGQEAMKNTCLKCHASTHVDKFYSEAEEVVVATNDKVKYALDIVDELRKEKLLTPEPFDEPIEFIAFDLWHYYGRTAKHGAFMGGADFVQWHGNYELLLKTKEIEEIARNLRNNSIDD